jgi:queuine tRNA-ribosyltransferase
MTSARKALTRFWKLILPVSRSADYPSVNRPNFIVNFLSPRQRCYRMTKPDYILDAVHNGIDIFDCVLPTRNARNGSLFTRDGQLSIKRESNTRDFGPVDPSCSCRVCREYSRAYLRHLYKQDEILFSMLATFHNLAFLHTMMAEISSAIAQGTFTEYRNRFMKRINGGTV